MSVPRGNGPLTVPPTTGERVLFPGIVSLPNDLRIERDLSFNEWRDLGAALHGIEDRSAWALAAWRVYGDRYADAYPDGVAKVDLADRTLAEYTRVYRAFPPAVRAPTLTFRHHLEIVAHVRDPDERLRWLSACERGQWSTRELVDRIGEDRSTGARPLALSFRAVGPVAHAINARAGALHVKPRDLALEVLELAAQLDDPVAVLVAAGARSRGGPPLAAVGGGA